MPGRVCRIRCRCRRFADGTALLAGAAYTGARSPVFLGTDYAALVAHPPIAFGAVLGAVSISAIVMIIIGLRAARDEREFGPLLWWVLSMAISIIVLSNIGLVPDAWGPITPVAIEGVCFSIIVGASATVLFAVHSRSWWDGHVSHPSIDWRSRVEQRDAEISNLRLRMIQDALERLQTQQSVNGAFEIPGVYNVLPPQPVRRRDQGLLTHQELTTILDKIGEKVS